MADGGTRSVEEFAERYDEWAGEYDDDYAGDDDGCGAYRACVSLVVEHAVGEARSAPDSASGQRPRALGPGDTVVDLGTGTGAVALALAGDAGEVIGRDVSEGMLERAREKARERGVGNVRFGTGRFRDPGVETADVVVSNWAIHHLAPGAQREAIETVAGLEPRRFVLSGAMYFDERDPAEPMFDPATVYPSTVGHLADALTDEGFALVEVERVHDECGVLVAESTGPG